MAICHKDITVGRNGNTGRLIESIRAIPRYSGLAEGHQHLARWTQLEDLVAPGHTVRVLSGYTEYRFVCICVARPPVSLPINSKPMGKREHPRAKARQKFARRIKFQNWRLRAADAGGGAGGHDIETSMKDPDVAFGIDICPDQLSPLTAIHVLRKHRPVLHQSIRIGELYLFGVLGLLGLGYESKRGDRRKHRYKRES